MLPVWVTIVNIIMLEAANAPVYPPHMNIEQINEYLRERRDYNNKSGPMIARSPHQRFVEQALQFLLDELEKARQGAS